MKLNILFLTLDDIMVLEFIGYSLEESLKDTSIGILDAHTEKDAIEIIEFQTVDLIIADMNIDTIESYEFYDKLQQDVKYKDIPFVFLSSNEEDQDIAILKGISNFFLKPLNVDQLLESLHNILKNTKSSQQSNNIEYTYSISDDRIENEEEIHLTNIKQSANEIENILNNNDEFSKDDIKKFTSSIKSQVDTLLSNTSNNTYSF